MGRPKASGRDVAHWSAKGPTDSPSTMAASKLVERMRLWLLLHDGAPASALVIGTAGLLFGGIILLALIPLGPAVELTGTIVGMRNLQTDQGTLSNVIVDLSNGRTITAAISRYHGCDTGDPVAVLATPRVWGKHHRIKRTGCAA